MRPEEYFKRDEDGLRLIGHRLWIEDILIPYLGGVSAQQIADDSFTLTLDEVEAAIAYYHANPDEMGVYLEQQRAAAESREHEAAKYPSPQSLRLHALREENRHSKIEGVAHA